MDKNPKRLTPAEAFGVNRCILQYASDFAPALQCGWGFSLRWRAFCISDSEASLTPRSNLAPAPV